MNRAVIRLLVLQACFFILLSAAAQAEAPWNFKVLTVNSGGTSQGKALSVSTTDKGHVAYHQCRPEAPALWLEIQTEAGKSIPLQLGVPRLDRYRHARPAVAILSPDLPPCTEKLPFTVPEGMGVQLLSTHDLKSAQYRDDYTGIVSWRFEKMHFTPLTTGSCYAVVFSPSVAEGSVPETKVWLTVGQGSSFRLSDLLAVYGNNLSIRSFFEEAVYISQVFSSSIIMVILTLIGVIVAIV